MAKKDRQQGRADQPQDRAKKQVSINDLPEIAGAKSGDTDKVKGGLRPGSGGGILGTDPDALGE